MEDKNRNTEAEQEEITAVQPEEAGNTEEESAQNVKKGIPVRSCIMMVFAGLYLVYTGYRLCENVLKGVDGGNWGFFAAGAGFFIVGAVMLFIGGKNWMKRDKEKKEAEEQARRENPQPEEYQEQKPMSIAERARLAEALSEKEAENTESELIGEEAAGEEQTEEEK